MNDAIAAAAALVPAVLMLTEGVKRAGIVPARFAVLVALAVGVLAAFVVPPSVEWRTEALTGLLAGAGASGIWSGTKALAAKG